MKKRRKGEFTVGPGNRLARIFGWNAENRKRESLDPTKVPEHLHDLIPLAEHWGVTCDVTRHDFAAKATDAQLAAVAKALSGRHEEIVDWLYFETEAETSSHEAAVFQALLVLELEECNGPGIPGYLDWAYAKYKKHSSHQTLSSLRSAYLFAKECDILKYHDAGKIDEIQTILGFDRSA